MMKITPRMGNIEILRLGEVMILGIIGGKEISNISWLISYSIFIFLLLVMTCGMVLTMEYPLNTIIIAYPIIIITDVKYSIGFTEGHINNGIK